MIDEYKLWLATEYVPICGGDGTDDDGGGNPFEEAQEAEDAQNAESVQGEETEGAGNENNQNEQQTSKGDQDALASTLAALNETIKKLPVQPVQAPVQTQQAEEEVIDEQLMYEDPKLYEQKLTEKITKKVLAETRQMLGAQTAEQSFVNRMYEEYPDLKDESSPLYLDIQKESQARKARGLVVDFQALEDITKLKAYEHGIVPTSKKKGKPAVQAKPKSESGAARTTAATNVNTKSVVTPTRNAVLKALGKNEEWGKGAYTKHSASKESVRR